MRVSLIEFTSNAAELLIFSKRTRLHMSADSYREIFSMSEEDKQKELSYIFNTIGSSWEFVDYTFMINDVSRAFTHQLVRHRAGVSFAQQSQRTVDMSGFNYHSSGATEKSEIYHQEMNRIRLAYNEMIDQGIPPEDARGILPTNVLTNILMKINLRALSDMLKVRLCYRSQGEFRSVAEELRRKVVEVHPWTGNILAPTCKRFGYCQFPNFTDCPRKQPQ